MAYGIVHQFAGGTEDQYRALIAAVHPSEGRLPDGQVFHAAGPSDDGWVIVAIHESKESWEKFRDTVLMPRMQAGIEGGIGAPPHETAFEVRIQTLAWHRRNRAESGRASSFPTRWGEASSGARHELLTAAPH